MSNRNLVVGAMLAGVVVAGAAVAVVVSSAETPDKIDLSSIHTTEESSIEETTAAESETTTAPETESAVSNDVQSLSYEIAAYQEGKISIQYPVISKMSDTAKQDQINQQLKDNALSLLKAWDTESGNCTISIKCQVPSISRKRITAVYTGYADQEQAAHPVNLFYTNTIDLNSGKDLEFSDFADPYTMAGYVLSDDVRFDETGSAPLADLLEFRKTQDIDYYTEIFSQADFPFDASETWPSSFSYEKQGVIYFSIPIAHSMGDYAVVTFTPDTK